MRKPVAAKRQTGKRATPRGEPRVELPAGMAARQEAVRLLEAVLARGRALDDALAETPRRASDIEPRDRAFARAIAMAVLRRLGELDAVLAHFITKPLPQQRGSLRSVLLSAAAQLLLLRTPPHAAISLAVEQTRRDRVARRFDKLVNAVLRRVASEGAAILATLDAVALDIPQWMLTRWIATYGEPLARAIAAASLQEAALDITAKDDPAGWAARLGGTLLSTGSIRVREHGRIEELEGFGQGAWWVQDAAAALPAKLLGDVRGLRVADLCAAPGGKTAELASNGARVTALDRSPQRLQKLRENLSRLSLEAEVVTADAATWRPLEPFDAVLLDAPCTATGTIRRHPDILRLKRPEDIGALAALQQTLFANAASLVKPGGRLVYCVCSLEPEEGPEQVARLLRQHSDLTREPIRSGEAAIKAEWLTAEGDLRTLPCQSPEAGEHGGGMDGFYVARLRRMPG